jgi:hypothetical protein
MLKSLLQPMAQQVLVLKLFVENMDLWNVLHFESLTVSMLGQICLPLLRSIAFRDLQNNSICGMQGGQIFQVPIKFKFPKLDRKVM